MFNLEDEAMEFDFPKDVAFINLMADMPAMGKVILPPLGARVFKRLND